MNRKRERNYGESDNAGYSINADTMLKLYVSNISWGTSDESLHEYFCKFGAIKKAWSVKDKGGRTKGYGFVIYQSQESVDECQKNIPHVLDNRELTTRRSLRDLGDPKACVDSLKIYCGGISSDTSEQDVRDYFSKFGVVTACNVKYKDKSYGFAFVEFEDKDVVDKIILMRDDHSAIKDPKGGLRKCLTPEQEEDAMSTWEFNKAKANRNITRDYDDNGMGGYGGHMDGPMRGGMGSRGRMDGPMMGGGYGGMDSMMGNRNYGRDGPMMGGYGGMDNGGRQGMGGRYQDDEYTSYRQLKQMKASMRSGGADDWGQFGPGGQGFMNMPPQGGMNMPPHGGMNMPPMGGMNMPPMGGMNMSAMRESFGGRGGMGGEGSSRLDEVTAKKRRIAEEKASLEAELMAEEAELEEMEIQMLKQRKLEMMRKKKEAMARLTSGMGGASSRPSSEDWA